MTIQVQCDCGARLSVSDESAGKRGQCPKCGAIVAIPARDDAIPAEPAPARQPHLYTGPSLPLWEPAPGLAGYMGSSGGSASPNDPQAAVRGDEEQVPDRRPWIKRARKILRPVVGALIAIGISILVRKFFEPQLGKLDWQPYHSVQGRFRVDMPGEVEPQSKTFPMASGERTLWLEGVKLKPGTAFVVSYMDLPSELLSFGPQQSLAFFMAGVASEHTVFKQSPIECDGYPGREAYHTAATSGGDIPARTRILIVGQRLYQLQYFGDEDTLDHADVQRFMNSFHPYERPTLPARHTTEGGSEP